MPWYDIDGILSEDGIQRDSNYDVLESILLDAYNQAAFGKGMVRHANNEPFEKQLIVFLEKLGLSFCAGQAVKKIIEASRTGSEEDLLGAINYIVAHIITIRAQGNIIKR